MKKYIFLLTIIAGIAAVSNAQMAWTEAFRQEGIASWYGREFDGKPTASGEIFNSDLYTAAHPTLPFGTILVVTNKQNMHKVTVRVNDRGPFVAARILDLSRAAAEVLDMIVTGTAPVIVERTADTNVGPVAVPAASAEIIPEPAPEPVQFTPAPAPVVTAPVEAGPVPDSQANTTQQPVSTQVSAPPADARPLPAFFPAPPAEIKGSVPQSGKLYRIQVGAYRIPRNAVEAFEKLKNAGLNPAYEQSGDFYRVVLAKLKGDDINSVAQTLGNAGFSEALIREETVY